MTIIKKDTLYAEYTEHSKQDIEDFNMDYNANTRLIIPEIVFSVNHDKTDRAQAQEELRRTALLYTEKLINDIIKI